MYRKPNMVSAFLVLLAVLALVAAARFVSHASASRPVNSGDARPRVVTVVIRGFKFEPENIIVQVGDTVEWKNEDTVTHTATEEGDDANPVFDSGGIRTGAAWRYLAKEKGAYNYICSLHPNMKGKLMVQ